MLLPDVNVLVNAFLDTAPAHRRDREWLDSLVNGPSRFAMSELVISGFVRVVTHPRIQRVPTPPAVALAYASTILSSPRCVRLRPGDRHLPIFHQLVAEVGATGNTIPDAFHAALAIESGSTWVTNDRGFARFPGLRWQLPG
jgi:toxin-antitoxin system PIN domain toxin